MSKMAQSLRTQVLGACRAPTAIFGGTGAFPALHPESLVRPSLTPHSDHGTYSYPPTSAWKFPDPLVLSQGTFATCMLVMRLPPTPECECPEGRAGPPLRPIPTAHVTNRGPAGEGAANLPLWGLCGSSLTRGWQWPRH